MAALYPLSKLSAASIDDTLVNLAARETYPDEAAARGLRAMRYLNSAQAAYWRTHKRFAPALELVKDAAAKLGPSTAVSAHAKHTSEVVDGFDLHDAVSTDGLHYSMILIQRSGGLAYETNQTGIIRVGSIKDGLFSGDYLQQPQPARSGLRHSKLAAFGGRIAEFFVPTLYASRGPSCCGTCGGHCVLVNAGECGSTCSICCNLGFSDCQWCCNVDCSCLGC